MRPKHKLVALALAAIHDEVGGVCNPSPVRVATLTGLPEPEVREIAADLAGLGIVIRRNGRFLFPGIDRRKPTPVPGNFWPSDEAIEALLRRYPDHDFDMEEAVNEFIDFCNRTGRRFADHDRAFVANISALLDRRQPGKVSLAGGEVRSRPRSVRALLSGRRAG